MDNPSKIVFKREDDEMQVVMVMPDGLTWSELTMHFISFLHANGYVFEGIDVADYLTSEFGYQRKKEDECTITTLSQKRRKKIKK